MIYFKKNIKDLKIYLHEMVWFSCKSIIILDVVCIPFILYFFLVGFLADKEALTYAFGILLLFIVLLLIIIRMILFYRKNLKMFFSIVNVDGDVESSIYLDNDELVMENISRKTINRIKLSEIKSLTTTKNIIFVKTSLRQSLFFPKTKELVEFFEQNSIIKLTKKR